jgi:hypothetical protein
MFALERSGLDIMNKKIRIIAAASATLDGLALHKRLYTMQKQLGTMYGKRLLNYLKMLRERLRSARLRFLKNEKKDRQRPIKIEWYYYWC